MASWMKKTGHVVADEVEVALVGVELDREAAHVAREVGRAARAGDGREAHEDRRLARRVAQEVGLRVARERLVDLEEAVGARAARVDDALGDALVVEVGDLLAEVEVLEQRRAAVARLELFWSSLTAQALVGGQRLVPVGRVRPSCVGSRARVRFALASPAAVDRRGAFGLVMASDVVCAIG